MIASDTARRNTGGQCAASRAPWQWAHHHPFRLFHPRRPYKLALPAANPEPDPDAQIDRIELKGEVPSLLKRPPGCEFHTRCPFAQERCRGEAPALTQDAPGHLLTCHFPRHREQPAA